MPKNLNAMKTPVHKGGSRAIPKNFRPVALTSHLIIALRSMTLYWIAGCGVKTCRCHLVLVREGLKKNRTNLGFWPKLWIPSKFADHKPGSADYGQHQHRSYDLVDCEIGKKEQQLEILERLRLIQTKVKYLIFIFITVGTH